MASMLSRCDEEKSTIGDGIKLEDSIEDIARNAASIGYVGGSDTVGLAQHLIYVLITENYPLDTFVHSILLPCYG